MSKLEDFLGIYMLKIMILFCFASSIKINSIYICANNNVYSNNDLFKDSVYNLMISLMISFQLIVTISLKILYLLIEKI